MCELYFFFFLSDGLKCVTTLTVSATRSVDGGNYEIRFVYRENDFVSNKLRQPFLNTSCVCIFEKE